MPSNVLGIQDEWTVSSRTAGAGQTANVSLPALPLDLGWVLTRFDARLISQGLGALYFGSLQVKAGATLIWDRAMIVPPNAANQVDFWDTAYDGRMVLPRGVALTVTFNAPTVVGVEQDLTAAGYVI